MLKKDINISIAAGEALLFLESSAGNVSIEDFDRFLRSTGLNVYLVLNLLLFEKLISIDLHERVVSVAGPNKKELVYK